MRPLWGAAPESLTGAPAMVTQHSANSYLPFERPIREIDLKIREFEELSRTNQMDFSEEIGHAWVFAKG